MTANIEKKVKFNGRNYVILHTKHNTQRKVTTKSRRFTDKNIIGSYLSSFH